MKEEKGGIIHIFFIFIGITLLALGLFYTFTDEKIDLKENTMDVHGIDDDTNNDKDKKESHNISKLNILKNIETLVTLDNKEEVTVSLYKHDDTNTSTFLYDGKSSFETDELEVCDEFYLYDNSIISFCAYGSSKGHLYIVDSTGSSTKIEKYKDGSLELYFKDISLENNKLIVEATTLLKETSIIKDGIEINLCNEALVKENYIADNYPVELKYELELKDNDLSLEFIENTIELSKFKADQCKTIE